MVSRKRKAEASLSASEDEEGTAPQAIKFKAGNIILLPFGVEVIALVAIRTTSWYLYERYRA